MKSLIDYNKVLEDDETEYGGVSFEGETLRDFLAEVGLDGCTDIYEINKALREAGIKPIENRKVLDTSHITTVTNWNDFFEFVDDKWSVSYQSVLKAIKQMEGLHYLLADYDDSSDLVYLGSVMRKELYEKMANEFETVRETENTPRPTDAVFIYRDSSNMYADYCYYYSPSEKKIYEELLALGD